MFDFTDAANAHEIAFFDRGPFDASKIVIAGYWSAYWYNGHIYGSEMARGLDIFALKPSELLTQNEIDAALLVKYDELNVQAQPRMTWPASFVVARAYIDQLVRSRTMTADRATALRTAMDRADKANGNERRAAVDALDKLVPQIESDATAARGHDAQRLTALAETIKGRIASLR